MEFIDWGKSRKIGSPKGMRIYHRQSQNEWRRAEIPERSNVTQALWNRSHDRLKLVPDLYGIREGKRQGRAAATPYLFTAIARSQCGGSITVSGRCRKREDSHTGKRGPSARSVAISAPLKKSEATNYTWDLGELGAVCGCAGQRRHVELQGFLHFRWRVGGF